jgi:hypothetical protein
MGVIARAARIELGKSMVRLRTIVESVSPRVRTLVCAASA